MAEPSERSPRWRPSRRRAGGTAPSGPAPGPAGQVAILQYVTGAFRKIDFEPSSQFAWRYFWRGGRASLDQALNQIQSAIIDRYDGLLFVGGQEYDTGQGAPLAEDPYAYFDPEGEHSTRSVVNTQYQTGNGTQPIWSTPTTRLLGALADSYNEIGAAVEGFAGSIYGSVVGGIKELGLRAYDFANTALYTATTWASGGSFSLGSNRSYSQLGQMMDSGEVSRVRATFSSVPGVGLYEWVAGEDVLTGRSVHGLDRWARGFAGLSDVAGLAVGGIELASRFSFGASPTPLATRRQRTTGVLSLDELAEGTARMAKFKEKLRRAGWKVEATRFDGDTIAQFGGDGVFRYDPGEFRVINLMHENRHLGQLNRAKRLNIDVWRGEHAKYLNAVAETEAYNLDLWLGERFGASSDFMFKTSQLRDHYWYKARPKLRYSPRFRQAANDFLGYDLLDAMGG